MKYGILTLIALMSGAVATAQTWDKDSIIYAIGQKGFAVVDTAIRLVEHYPDVRLQSTLGKIIDVHLRGGKIKKVVPATHFDDGNIGSMGGVALNDFVFRRLDQTMNLLEPYENTNPVKNLYRSLCHHAKLLFQNTLINDGKDFDETLLMDYHLHRMRLLQLVDAEILRYRFTVKARCLQDSLESVRKQLIIVNRQLATLTDSVNSKLERARQSQKREHEERNDWQQKSVLTGIAPRRAVEISELSPARTQALRAKVLAIRRGPFVRWRRKAATNRFLKDA